MLKPQDCMILIKLLSNLERDYSQRELAGELFMSQSEVNQSLKRLVIAGLARKRLEGNIPRPIVKAAEDFLIYGLKYCFPVKPKSLTPGIPTGIGAPIFKNKIMLGDEPLPVWPYAEGTIIGQAIEPLYSSIPKAIDQTADQNFYDLLALVDIIRFGRARERNIAIDMLKKKLSS